MMKNSLTIVGASKSAFFETHVVENRKIRTKGEALMERLKKIARRFRYICFLMIITPLLCEGVVRVYSWISFPKMMRINSSYGWYHATDSQKVFITEGEKALIVQNKLGHRGANYGP